MRGAATAVTLLLAAPAMLAAGCGSSSSANGSSAAQGGTLNVFAASSLTEAFTELAPTFESQNPGWKVRLNFLGSDELAAQIEQGIDADVYAAASAKYPEQLQGEKMLGDTTDFATNTLVLITPKDNPAGIHSVQDLTKGAKLVVGDPAVPIGSYTETVLANLGIDPSSLAAIGYADTRPRLSNASEEGRKRNRRIQIVLTPKPADVPEEPKAAELPPEEPTTAELKPAKLRPAELQPVDVEPIETLHVNVPKAPDTAMQDTATPSERPPTSN